MGSSNSNLWIARLDSGGLPVSEVTVSTGTYYPASDVLIGKQVTGYLVATHAFVFSLDAFAQPQEVLKRISFQPAGIRIEGDHTWLVDLWSVVDYVGENSREAKFRHTAGDRSIFTNTLAAHDNNVWVSARPLGPAQ